MSDGLVQNSSVNCSFHIYNSTGHHIIEGFDSVPSHNYDYELVVGVGNITSTGLYALHVYCECSGCGADQANLGGFVRHTFEVTSDGYVKNRDGTGFYVVLVLIPLIFALFMLVGAATLGDDHNVLRIFLFLLSVPMIWISLHWSMIGVIRFYGLVELQEAIGTTTYWLGWLFFVVVTYFVIYLVWKMFDYMSGKKDERLNY